MLQNITVTNYLGEELTLSMYCPERSGFYIKSVDGLGPSNANINVLDIVSIDGGIFNNARLDKRNIVLTLGVVQGIDSEQIRQTSYKYFPIKRKLRLKFESDHKTATIYGYVESNEPTIWSKDVSMKISIICPQPYFTSAFENSITFAGDSDPHTIVYDGDADTGLVATFNIGSDTRGLKIKNHKGEYIAINDSYLSKVTSLLKYGDVVTINSKVNEKSITLKRGNQTINILNALDRGSKWLKIGKGNNNFTIEATSGLNDMNITISNPVLFEGI